MASRIMGMLCPLLAKMRLDLGWRYLSLNVRPRCGYAAITWYRDMTPWFFSYENSAGLWSISAHVPRLQLLVIGPFTKAARNG